ncbi:MOSC domain-containing protein [Erythrobacter gaetbuli]|uniref:MOSC domain-containing protein n=1 Tax=Qipengyuania gaetbuli TaxID=266952 RepID=A0A844XYP0_9SPHN|nr:MOSC domain-containing protein [Qipengyuania gaetbuli]MXO50686.1 MOSC domain-containing protein [Qipengyuania gaetbuli]
MTCEIRAICVGLPKPFNGAEPSAIAKAPVAGRVKIRAFGIEGDMVADTKHHGGADMAVHHYPGDHYADWNDWLGGHELLAGPAAFGENLMSLGLVETQVHVGDRFRLGTAILEISQGRQPCWKIEHRFQRKGMVARILETGRCGWYYRVIEEGEAAAGDRLERIETVNPEWSVARVFAALYDKANPPSPADLETLANMNRLSEVWRGKAAAKL